mgnify:CR=1 FL=1
MYVLAVGLRPEPTLRPPDPSLRSAAAVFTGYALMVITVTLCPFSVEMESPQ